jgi:threonine dehydrogenase-like Zn-dependent dehydrogenase
MQSVGVCMEPDEIQPAMAINKEIDLRLSSPTRRSSSGTPHLLAEGKVDAGPIVTGAVGLSGVEEAFAALEDAETQAKILIDPKLSGEQVTAP